MKLGVILDIKSRNRHIIISGNIIVDFKNNETENRMNAKCLGEK